MIERLDTPDPPPTRSMRDLVLVTGRMSPGIIRDINEGKISATRELNGWRFTQAQWDAAKEFYGRVGLGGRRFTADDHVQAAAVRRANIARARG